MTWLPDGKNISKISLFVLTECTNVTVTQTDRHRPSLHSVARQILQELSNRKQIARQLRTQYVEGIYDNPVTLKSGLDVTKCH